MSKCDFVYRLTSCSNDNTFEYIKLNIWKRQEVCLIIQMAIQRVHKLKLDDRHHSLHWLKNIRRFTLNSQFLNDLSSSDGELEDILVGFQWA